MKLHVPIHGPAVVVVVGPAVVVVVGPAVVVVVAGPAVVVVVAGPAVVVVVGPSVVVVVGPSVVVVVGPAVVVVVGPAVVVVVGPAVVVVVQTLWPRKVVKRVPKQFQYTDSPTLVQSHAIPSVVGPGPGRGLQQLSNRFHPKLPLHISLQIALNPPVLLESLCEVLLHGKYNSSPTLDGHGKRVRFSPVSGSSQQS